MLVKKEKQKIKKKKKRKKKKKKTRKEEMGRAYAEKKKGEEEITSLLFLMKIKNGRLAMEEKTKTIKGSSLHKRKRNT